MGSHGVHGGFTFSAHRSSSLNYPDAALSHVWSHTGKRVDTQYLCDVAVLCRRRSQRHSCLAHQPDNAPACNNYPAQEYPAVPHESKVNLFKKTTLGLFPGIVLHTNRIKRRNIKPTTGQSLHVWLANEPHVQPLG